MKCIRNLDFCFGRNYELIGLTFCLDFGVIWISNVQNSAFHCSTVSSIQILQFLGIQNPDAKASESEFWIPDFGFQTLTVP